LDLRVDALRPVGNDVPAECTHLESCEPRERFLL
jgi:hypothetical protein